MIAKEYKVIFVTINFLTFIVERITKFCEYKD